MKNSKLFKAIEKKYIIDRVLFGWAEYVAHLQTKERAFSVLHRETHTTQEKKRKQGRAQ